MQQWEYAVMEWLWNANKLRVNLPDGAEQKLAGSYAEVVSTLTSLGREGWEVVGCVAAGNWLFWTLKRQASGRNGFQYP